MKRTIFLFLISFTSCLSHAALESRLGGQAYYDTLLNISWLTDTKNSGSVMSWDVANTWALNLSVDGITGWRLPTVNDTGALGCNFAHSGTDCGYNVDISTIGSTRNEMAHMFYATLGNLGNYDTDGNSDQPGWGLGNKDVFTNLQATTYWSGTEDASDSGRAWHFGFLFGDQGAISKSSSFYAWAVYTGDVGAAVVPIPTAIWLFGTGLIGLVGVAHKRRAFGVIRH